MIVTLTDAAKAVDADRDRSKQTVMGASNIGPCIRQGAYYYHGVEPTDVDEGSMSAILGTWIHEGALEALRRIMGALVETLVEHPSGKVRGHIDAVYLTRVWLRRIRAQHRPPESHDGVTVEDVKTRADDRMIDTVRLYGPPDKEWRQVYTYVWLWEEYGAKVDPARPRLALQRAVAALGPIPVDRVRLRYLARDRGEEYVVEQPVDRAMVDEARERFEYVERSTSPESLPREQDGPGLSYVCDSCPFRTACWGSTGPTDDGVWPQAVRIVEGSTTEATELARYLDGMRLEKAGKDAKALARATLSGSEPLEVPGVARLKWRGTERVEEVPDGDAAVAILVEAGAEVPTKTVRRSKTISVSAV